MRKVFFLVLLAFFLGCWVQPQVEQPEPRVYIEDLISKTAKIEVFCFGEGSWTGSGVILWGSETFGLKVATAAHVIGDFDTMHGNCRLTVVTRRGKYKAAFAFKDDKRDIGIVTTLEGYYSPMLEYAHGHVGDEVIAIGYPWDSLKRKPQLSVSRGVVLTEYDDWRDSSEAYRVSASIRPGSSGGGLWTPSGKLVGLTVSMWRVNGVDLWDHAYVTAIEGGLPLFNRFLPVEETTPELEVSQ